MATSSVLAWKITWMKKRQDTVHGVPKSQTQLPVTEQAGNPLLFWPYLIWLFVLIQYIIIFLWVFSDLVMGKRMYLLLFSHYLEIILPTITVQLYLLLCLKKIPALEISTYICLVQFTYSGISLLT